MDAWLIWALALFVAGLIIAAIEVMLPSGGLLAVAALVCLGGSIACAAQISSLAAIILAGVEVVCVPVLIVFMFKMLPKTRLGRGLMLMPPKTAKDTVETPSAVTTSSPYGELLGKEGVVVAPLRPSGTADVDGRRVSVVTDGQLVDPGRRVRVVLVEGSRVVVEPVEGG